MLSSLTFLLAHGVDKTLAPANRPQYGIHAGQDEEGEGWCYCQHLRTEQLQQQFWLWNGGREIVGLT